MTQHSARVTVAIPTFNRSRMLIDTIDSVLNQNYEDVRVLVLDDASSDDTEAAVSAIDDPRLDYVRNPHNIGQVRNWFQALELNRSPYLSLLPDDDILLPGFLERSVETLDANPSADLSVTRARGIGPDGGPVPPDSSALPDPAPAEISGQRLGGLEFLHHVVVGRGWVYLQPAMVMMRASGFEAAGSFDPRHARGTFDFSLWIRLAAQSDIVFVDEELALIRIHEGQLSHTLYRQSDSVGVVGLLAERMEAGLHLLASPWSAKPDYREWLSRTLLRLSAERSQETARLLPGLNLSWDQRVAAAIQRIEQNVRPETDFVLVDSDEWNVRKVGDRKAVPLVMKDGRYWGPPADDATAIQELERSRSEGAEFIVFGWSAFWWFDYYKGFRRYLDDNYLCVAEEPFITAFDLTKGVSS